jgi:hypothetical protein
MRKDFFNIRINSLLCCLILNLVYSCSYSKIPTIEAPYVDNSLKDFHFRQQHYQNIYNKKYDDYFFIYPSKYKDSNVSLFDMKGNLIHQWDHTVKRAKLIENCNLLLIDHSGSKGLQEIDSQNNVIWNHDPRGFTHHDFEITQNGDFAFFYSTVMPETFDLKNGCQHNEVTADNLVIINKSGKKLFNWHFPNHYPDLINKDLCNQERMEYVRKSGFTNLLDSIHPNSIDIIKPNLWYKKGYKEFKPGNLLITLHHLNRAIIIDKDSKKVVWMYQPQNSIGLEGPHEAEMIPEGFPGAGNILIFDNGNLRKYSRIIEINPISKKILWEYKDPTNFYSRIAGSQQRLKNGDTFISDDDSGRVFIVNKKGEIKWQFTDGENQEIRRASLMKKAPFAHCFKTKWGNQSNKTIDSVTH